MNVLFQLHPGVTDEYMVYLESIGAKISSRNIADLIPLCDIFVTSVSSVIRLAIVCGIPVINYDVYRFQYTDYVDAKGVLTIQDKAKYKNTLDKLIADRSYYKLIKDNQKVCSGQWGFLDGKVGTRMMEYFDTL